MNSNFQGSQHIIPHPIIIRTSDLKGITARILYRITSTSLAGVGPFFIQTKQSVTITIVSRIYKVWHRIIDTEICLVIIQGDTSGILDTFREYTTFPFGVNGPVLDF